MYVYMYMVLTRCALGGGGPNPPLALCPSLFFFVTLEPRVE